MRSFYYSKCSQKKGFTLIEMVVAMAIFVMLTSVLLFNYNNFNKRLNLDLLSHQIAQWVRDAQISAMSVRQSRTVSGKFPGYGIHFERAKPDQFVYFADLGNGAGGAPNKHYDPPVAPVKCGALTTECEKVISLLQGNRIEKICGSTTFPGPSQGDCPAGLTSIQKLDIVFIRPNPDANIQGEYQAGSIVPYGQVNIMLISPKGYRRTVEVWTTGQISVR